VILSVARRRSRCAGTCRGITRIDLAILVVCIAMLTVVAVPRYAGISHQSRYRQVLALSQSLTSAVRLADSIWNANGRPVQLQLQGGTIDMVNGYPTPATVSVLMNEPELAAFDFNDGSWQHAAVPRRRLCGVSYWPPARFGELPMIRTHLSGC